MQILSGAAVVLLAYVFGSIPFGLLIVRLTTGKDLRQVASGRTGGTNAARAAGLGAGLLTALMDGLKGAAAVWMAQAVFPGNPWMEILAPIAAILGHNYSIFIVERDEKGYLHLRGGAGGAPTVGGAVGMWWPSILIIVPVGVLVFFGIGYASVTTMSIAVIVTIIFTVRYFQGLANLQQILFGVVAIFLLVWSLRPNIQALVEGRERFHGWRPWKRQETIPLEDERPPGVQTKPTRKRGPAPRGKKVTSRK
jgi:acyl phosphate:glycerol-3-phosphate acyltransferase